MMKKNALLDVFSRLLCLGTVDWDSDFSHDGYRDTLGLQPVSLNRQERRAVAWLLGTEEDNTLDLCPHLRETMQVAGR